MKWFIVAGFLVAFCAGGVIALQMKPAAVASESRGESSWLPKELHLTAAQAEEFKKIWSEGVRATLKEQEERRRVFRRDREEGIARLIPEENKAAYQQIMDRYAAQSSQLSQERSKAFEVAQEKTRQILNAEQRQKYEEIVKKRSHARRSETRPSTRPVQVGAKATTEPAGQR